MKRIIITGTFVNGYEDGTFRPGHAITREEALVMFSRAMQLARVNSQADEAAASTILSGFTDGSAVTSWAKPAVAEAIRNGLFYGTGNALQPKKDITRAETASILERMLKKAGLVAS